MLRHGPLALLVVIVACGPDTRAGIPSDRQILQAQLDAIEALFGPGRPTAESLEGYLRFFAPDAILLPPGGDPILGRAAALAFYTEGFDGLDVISLAYGTAEVLHDGGLATRRSMKESVKAGLRPGCLRSRVGLGTQPPLGWNDRIVRERCAG